MERGKHFKTDFKTEQRDNLEDIHFTSTFFFTLGVYYDSRPLGGNRSSDKLIAGRFDKTDNRVKRAGHRMDLYLPHSA